MTGPVQPVAAVIFDWGGTLPPWHTIGLAERWRVFARAHAASAGTTAEEAARLAERIISGEDAAWRLASQDGTIWTRAYRERILARDGVLDLIDGAVYSSEIQHAKRSPVTGDAAAAPVAR